MKRVLFAFAVSICLNQVTYPEKVMGPGRYKNKRVDFLEIMGPLTGVSLIASRIDVYGPADLSENSEIGQAVIRGHLKASNTTFTDSLQAYGNIEVDQVMFNKDIATEGNEVTILLENSSAQGITISGVESGTKISKGTTTSTYFTSNKKELLGNRVILKGKKTKVSGPIEFINTPGTVILEENAVYDGSIVNGKLQKEDLKKPTLKEKDIEV